MLKVTFGKQTVGTTQVAVWFSKFKSAVTSVNDGQACLGHPLVSRIDENLNQVKEFVLENRRFTIHEVVNMFKI
jgi:hypothetical protein